MKRALKLLDIRNFFQDIHKFGLRFFFFRIILKLFNRFGIKGNFLSFKETYDFIKNSNKSIIRIGDGEIALIMGKSIIYQDYNDNLRDELSHIISSYNENSNYLICIANTILQASNNKLKRLFNNLDIWMEVRIYFLANFPKKLYYGEGNITRLLGHYSINIENKLRESNIIFLANEEVINQANFKKKNVIKIIPKTKRNSYFERDELMDQIYENLIKFDKSDVVVILSCGPLAKVLAYNISELGYRALDLGYMFESSNIPEGVEFFHKLLKD